MNFANAADLPSVRNRDHPHAIKGQPVLDDGLLLFPGHVGSVDISLHAGHLDPTTLVIVDGCKDRDLRMRINASKQLAHSVVIGMSP